MKKPRRRGLFSALKDLIFPAEAANREQNLRNELRFQALMKIVPVGIFQSNLKGELTYVNEQWQQMMGIPVKELEAGRWSEIIHPDDLPHVFQIWSEGTQKRTNYQFEFRLRPPDSKERWVHTQVVFLTDSMGETVGSIGASMDITAHKEIEEKALESSRLKSSFVANMSHEIRTPLNGVIGFTDLLLETPLAAEQQDYVETIRKSGETLLHLINDTLDFSKIEAGRLELEKMDFDPRVVFQETVEAFSYQATAKGVDLGLKLDFPEGLYLKGDAGRLRQILNNLISNALKFTEKGSVQIVASLKSLSSTGGSGAPRVELFCEVIDSGIGMRDNTLPRLFRSFTQAEASTTRNFGGTGLGLSICKGLVDLMGGEIGAQSRFGEGSRFWFCIAFAEGAKPASRELPVLGPDLILKKSQRFLVVDDNPINQKVAIRILQKLGHSADGVGNGVEAIRALERESYNLILMDCQMPELDGYETTRRIRTHPKEPLRSVPVIAMTANAVAGDREKCLECGMNDYVSKPLRLEDLCAAINHCL